MGEWSSSMYVNTTSTSRLNLVWGKLKQVQPFNEQFENTLWKKGWIVICQENPEFLWKLCVFNISMFCFHSRLNGWIWNHVMGQKCFYSFITHFTGGPCCASMNEPHKRIFSHIHTVLGHSAAPTGPTDTQTQTQTHINTITQDEWAP